MDICIGSELEGSCCIDGFWDIHFTGTLGSWGIKAQMQLGSLAVCMLEAKALLWLQVWDFSVLPQGLNVQASL